jgi:hypothetical protein
MAPVVVRFGPDNDVDELGVDAVLAGDLLDDGRVELAKVGRRGRNQAGREGQKEEGRQGSFNGVHRPSVLS